jgi:hypothetical protein
MGSVSEWLVALGVLAVLVPIGVWAIRRVKRSKHRASFAGMLLLFGTFLTIDPPPPPAAERVVRDEEDEEAAGDPPRP